MMIDWSNILISSGILTFIISIIEVIRSWKSKKTSEKAEAAKKEAEANAAIIDNWKNYADTIKTDNDNYRMRTDKKIEQLEQKISVLETKERIKEKALSEGWRCEHFIKHGVCPILEKITQKD